MRPIMQRLYRFLEPPGVEPGRRRHGLLEVEPFEGAGLDVPHLGGEVGVMGAEPVAEVGVWQGERL